jgi:hypothetical protein
MSKSKAYLGSAIVLYFAICFEILIMISPFAAYAEQSAKHLPVKTRSDG